MLRFRKKRTSVEKRQTSWHGSKRRARRHRRSWVSSRMTREVEVEEEAEVGVEARIKAEVGEKVGSGEEGAVLAAVRQRSRRLIKGKAIRHRISLEYIGSGRWSDVAIV